MDIADALMYFLVGGSLLSSICTLVAVLGDIWHDRELGG